MIAANTFHRRDLLASLAGATSWTLGKSAIANLPIERGLKIATFRFDVTPPLGHSLCGGWIPPVQAVDDELEAVGVVIVGEGEPIVLCAVDWTGLLNQAHLRWREVLARAAGTVPERVAVQCVHQHNAPFACLQAEQIVAQFADLPHIIEVDFFESTLKRAAESVGGAMKRLRPLTHIGTGSASVSKVASNRRVARDADGKVSRMRGSSCKDAALRQLPEGLIDPQLKTIGFYDREHLVAVCHYYATHPMSYYGDGRVSSDFVGLARKRRQAERPGVAEIYFTGCAGNVAAGKYNDGSKPMRQVLANQVYDALKRSEASLTRQAIESLQWRTVEMLPVARDSLNIAELQSQIANSNNRVVNRNRPSYMLSWLQRLQEMTPIVLSSLSVNQVSALHLPAESFIQYQLRAQQIASSRFVATAAYGDGGPWYIPVAEEYAAGGYEVSVAFSDPTIDTTMTTGIRRLLL